MGINIHIPGFSLGLVDPEYTDRVGGSNPPEFLKELENFWIDGSSSLQVRAALKRLNGSYFAPTVTGNITNIRMLEVYKPSGSFVLIMFYEDDGTAPITVRATAWDSSTDTFSSHNMGQVALWGGAGQEGIHAAQVGDDVYVTREGMVPQVITDYGNGSVSDAVFYEEIAGVVTRGVRRVYTSTAPTHVYVVGDTLVGSTSSAVILYVEKDDTIVLDTDGQTTMTDATGNVVTFSTADDVLVGTGTSFTDDFVTNDAFYILGVRGIVNVVYDDYMISLDNIDLVTTGGIFQARAAKDIATPFKCRTVALFQNRLVFANFDDSTEGARVLFTAAYDIKVALPGPKFAEDPAAPIDIIIGTGVSDQILWMASGDTLFLGGRSKEYALVNQGAIGASAAALPDFRPIGSSGSSALSPVDIHNGQILFGSRAGGEVMSARFSFQEARHNFLPMSQLVPSLFSDPLFISSRSRVDGDGAERIVVVDSDGSVSLGTILSADRPPAWSKVTLPSSVLVKGAIEVDSRIIFLIKETATGTYSYAEFDLDETDQALDFVSVPVEAPAGTFTLSEKALFSQTVFYTATLKGIAPARRVAGGYAQVDAAGVMTGQDTDSFENFEVGLPVHATAKLGKVGGEDNKGTLMNRTRRIVAARVAYSNTRQFIVEGEPALTDGENLEGLDPPLRSGTADIHMFGYEDDPTVHLESMVPYRGTLKSITLEVTG